MSRPRTDTTASIAGLASSVARVEQSGQVDTSAGDVGAVTVRLDLATVSESNARGHWGSRARRAREQRRAVRIALARLSPPPGPWVVALVRIGPRPLDGDNAQGALKACRDAVAVWLGVDDAPDAPVTWTYGQETTRETRREVVRRRGAIYMTDVPAYAVRISIAPACRSDP